jgi:FOG: TPR repeat, SEL1 subfamily
MMVKGYNSRMDGFCVSRKGVSRHFLPGMLFALFLCLPDIACAGRKGEKMSTVDEMRESITFSVMMKAATEDDDTAAQLWLADMYFTGKGGDQNYAKAREWYLKAAEKHARDAYYNLGVMYVLGKGAEKDPEAGVAWLEKAALDGDVEAQYLLGQMFFYGEGVKTDQEKAAYWWGMGAVRDEKKSLYNLGLSCYHGHGVMPDDVKAADLWQRASAQGMKEAQYNLAVMYDEGRGVPQDMAKALAFFIKAGEQGHALAQVALGWIYETGRGGVPVDILEAIRWYEMAAAQGMEQGKQRLQMLRGTAGFGMAQ